MTVDTVRGTRRFQRFVQRGGRKPEAEPPRSRGILDPALLRAALPQAVRKLDPRVLAHNPVMFVVELTAILVSLVVLLRLTATTDLSSGTNLQFDVQIAAWLWFTVLFATYAEAVAEARGRAQASTLRRTRSVTTAHRREPDGTLSDVGSAELRAGDVVLVREGETIPSDGDVIEGVAYVNEAAITGESAPVLKEPGTDIRSSVTGGTTVVSDQLVIHITANPGETFLDRMISLVEGAARQKTPNELALSILLAGLTLVFLLATVTLEAFAAYAGVAVSVVALVALLVCLIPTTIGGLLSAIGIAGMDRVARFNVLAMSGRAVEAAGDVDVILLDKTGTITFGNRLASAIIPAPGVPEAEALELALLSSLRDETPEGRSIVTLARRRLAELGQPGGDGDDEAIRVMSLRIAEQRDFSAETRSSGVVLALGGGVVLKGAVDAIAAELPDGLPAALDQESEAVAGRGATPLVLRFNAAGDRPDRAQGHRQAGPVRAVRRVPADGRAHRDDHGRQPPHGRDDRA